MFKPACRGVDGFWWLIRAKTVKMWIISIISSDSRCPSFLKNLISFVPPLQWDNQLLWGLVFFHYRQSINRLTIIHSAAAAAAAGCISSEIHKTPKRTREQQISQTYICLLSEFKYVLFFCFQTHQSFRLYCCQQPCFCIFSFFFLPLPCWFWGHLQFPSLLEATFTHACCLQSCLFIKAFSHAACRSP